MVAQNWARLWLIAWWHQAITWTIEAKWHHMATEIWVNIGSDNGLLPDGTKPLHEPTLTNLQWGVVTFTSGQFHGKSSRYLPLICLKKNKFEFPIGIWVKHHRWQLIKVNDEALWGMDWQIFDSLPHCIWHDALLGCQSQWLCISQWDVTEMKANITQYHTYFNTLCHREAIKHWGWDKMATTLETTCSNSFSCMKIVEFL